MSPLLALEAQPDVARPAAAAPRRSRVPALLAAAGLALLLLAAGLAVPRAAGAAVTGAPEVVRGPALTTLEAYGPVGSHVLGYEHGAEVLLRLPVRNSGPLPVTVTAAALDTARLPLLSASLDAPVRLGGGEAGELVLRGALDHCRHYHEREVQLASALVVTESLLGVERERTVALDRPLVVHSPMIVGCPDRTLDRSDDAKGDGFRVFTRT